MRFLALFAVLFAARTALAHPPPPELAEPEPTSWRDDRAIFEYSSWIRLAYGMQTTPSDVIARSTSPTPTRLYDHEGAWDVGLGADVTFPFPTKHVRLGPWIELRPQGVFSGGELSIAGKDVDMFMYEGERVYTLRVGSSTTDVTASLAFGYRCPWKLWGPYNRATRYMIGARLVATATRSATDPHDWSGSFGIEFEPVGALRYVAAIKSWY